MMSETGYDRYIIRKPVYEEQSPEIKNRQSPTMTFISNKQIPGVDNYIELGWIYGIPEPNPFIYEHIHDYDQIILYWGGNADTPQDLGAEIEYYIGGQPVTFNTTAGIFIPKGTPHGPVTWNKFRFPHIQMTLTPGTGEVADIWSKSGISDSGKQLPVKKDKFDYEQYVIRSPMRETGEIFTRGRQSPTMTYMSRTQINAADYYIEFGWIWDEVEPSIGEMRHEKYNEIVLHIGGNPDNPEDLGADMEFGLGGELFSLNTSFGVYIPRGVPHGPLNFKTCRKPYIEMAIMLGAGTHAEGWADSFFESPKSQ